MQKELQFDGIIEGFGGIQAITEIPQNPNTVEYVQNPFSILSDVYNSIPWNLKTKLNVTPYQGGKYITFNLNGNEMIATIFQVAISYSDLTTKTTVNTETYDNWFTVVDNYSYDWFWGYPGDNIMIIDGGTQTFENINTTPYENTTIYNSLVGFVANKTSIAFGL